MNNEQQNQEPHIDQKNKQHLMIGVITTIIFIAALVLLIKSKGSGDASAPQANTNAPQISVLQPAITPRP